MHDGPDAMSFEDRPDEEGKTSSRYKVRLDGEEMADLVDWKPDGRKREEPEEEEGDIVTGICTLRWEGVGKVLVAGPDRTQHQSNAFA